MLTLGSKGRRTVLVYFGSVAFVAVALLGAAGALRQQPSERPQSVSIGEDTARRWATKTVLPQFPEESLTRGVQGVAVVEVVFDVDGEVLDATALQAPDSVCRQASIRAARQWTFKPLNGPNGRPARVTTKLTFYFEIDRDRKGIVSHGTIQDAARTTSDSGRFAGSIDAHGVTRLAAKGGLRIIDIRPRELSGGNRPPDAVVMPLDEIGSRAREFRGVKSVVVVCYSKFENLCDAAAREVVRYTDVGRVFVLSPSPGR